MNMMQTQAMSAAAAGHFPSPMVGPGRVLLVDDDVASIRLMTRFLAKSGLEVGSVENGENAVDRLATERFDVVVSDLVMPGISGVDLMQRVHANCPESTFILVTANPSVDSAILALEGGAAHYLRKPIDKEEFSRVVMLALEKSRETAANRRLSHLMAQIEEEKRRLLEAFDRARVNLRMAFQPIFRVPEGTILAYEALMRSPGPSLGTPLMVLDAAERLGQIVELGRTVRRLVSTALRARVVDSVFLNLHSHELSDPTLVSEDNPLHDFAQKVTLEITERARVEFDDAVLSTLGQLRERGYRIAIDDLGVGYSGLTSVILVEPDIVKLDISLIRGIHKDERRQRLVKSLMDHCSDSGIRVVAEGVEEVAELDVLLQLGCDLVQGFLLGRPGFIPGF